MNAYHVAEMIFVSLSMESFDNTESAWFAGAAAIMSAVAAIASSITAIVAVRAQRKWSSSDAFLRLSAQFELPEFRRYRIAVYTLDRSAYLLWTDEEKEAVNAWCAHLDLLAIMMQTGQLHKLAFLNLYGDVVLRSIYQIAPYCNYQIEIRGKQFLLPLRVATCELIKAWRKQARRKRYPITIGFPSQPQIRVNPDLFDSDSEILRFRVDSRLS